MNPVLDIGPLRSLVAIADCGGFGRAALALALTQSAVSQHVRRLEAVAGAPLVERVGRQARFTEHGQRLLTEARAILAAHDNALRRVENPDHAGLVFGTTEHGVEALMPETMAAVREALPGRAVRFRFDRGARLIDALERGVLDAALVLGDAGPGSPGPRAAAHPVGQLAVSWYAAPEHHPEPGVQELGVVVFDQPCTVRRMLLRALGETGLRPRIATEAADLAGLLATARAGAGVTLLAAGARRPEGLTVVAGLPSVEALPVYLYTSSRLGAEVVEPAADAVRATVSGHG